MVKDFHRLRVGRFLLPDTPTAFFLLVETAALRNMAKYWEQRGKSKELPAVSSLSLPSRLAQISNGIADWLVISRNGPRGTLKVKYLGSCTLGPWSRLHTRPTCVVRTTWVGKGMLVPPAPVPVDGRKCGSLQRFRVLVDAGFALVRSSVFCLGLAKPRPGSRASG
ncbi:hypothetical protein BDP81DRAFT_422016 [Colletotrichum phormii]|uniref:Uncharacterized protein n=1 Tax=Colletotrichum phormii TaxID=359342 RepID=A0AAJ0EID6_9PEZI|nr:uncharacterized protein BDP81DRAFT_422016 [Colletotrichum phormii]KAK1639894.1 hypothetical protein BDP81DRAFT_422016 [Colletotrichum phormii]